MAPALTSPLHPPSQPLFLPRSPLEAPLLFLPDAPAGPPAHSPSLSRCTLPRPPSSHQVLLRVHRLAAHHGFGVCAGQRCLQHLLDGEQAGCRGGGVSQVYSITALLNPGLVQLQNPSAPSHAPGFCLEPPPPSSLPLCNTHAIPDETLPRPFHCPCSCHRTGIPPQS